MVAIELVGRHRAGPNRTIRANGFHGWRNGKLVEHRAYVDQLESQQPPTT